MKATRVRFTTSSLPPAQADDASCVLGWIDDMVAAGFAEFDDSKDDYPLLHLATGEVFVLGASELTRLR